MVYRCDYEMYSQPHHPMRIINMYRLLLSARYVFITRALDSSYTASDKQVLEKLICVVACELDRSMLAGQCFIRGWEEGTMINMNQNVWLRGDLEVAVLSTTNDVKATMKMWWTVFSSVEEAGRTYAEVSRWLGGKIKGLLEREGQVPGYGDMAGMFS